MTRLSVWERSATLFRPCLVWALVAGFSMGLALTTAQAHAKNSAIASVTVRTLAQGPVKNLPAGKLYVNILDFRQVPNTTFRLGSHVTGMVYTLRGVATVASPGAATRSVGPGGGAFLPSLAVQTISNVDGRFGAVAIAASLIVAVILLSAAKWLPGALRPLVTPVLSLLLIAGGAFVLTGGTSNDWYLIVVRSTQQRTLPMPVPYGRVGFSSPNTDPAPTAPFIETLSSITVPVGTRYDALNAGGPEMIIVVEGRAAVHAGGDFQQLESGGAAFAQTANTLSIVNSGSDTLQVLDFAIMALSAAPTAR